MEISTKTYPFTTFFATNPVRNALGYKPGLLGEQPATDV
jgi:hypothetical protein